MNRPQIAREVAFARMRRVPRVLRVISRLNVGGPAIQALTLTSWLEPLGYETTLVRGVEGPREGTMDDLAAELGVRPKLLRSLGRELGPHDARALMAMTSTLRSIKPHILHTHMAKAGTIGRVAAMLAGAAAPPVRVHTFHGHVLTGYFSAPKARLFASIERRLAKSTTSLWRYPTRSGTTWCGSASRRGTRSRRSPRLRPRSL